MLLTTKIGANLHLARALRREPVTNTNRGQINEAYRSTFRSSHSNDGNFHSSSRHMVDAGWWHAPPLLQLRPHRRLRHDHHFNLERWHHHRWNYHGRNNHYHDLGRFDHRWHDDHDRRHDDRRDHYDWWHHHNHDWWHDLGRLVGRNRGT